MRWTEFVPLDVLLRASCVAAFLDDSNNGEMARMQWQALTEREVIVPVELLKETQTYVNSTSYLRDEDFCRNFSLFLTPLGAVTEHDVFEAIRIAVKISN
jgi:hypothetical protein